MDIERNAIFRTYAVHVDKRSFCTNVQPNRPPLNFISRQTIWRDVEAQLSAR